MAEIAADPTAYWVGGGDYIEAISPIDVRRFDFRNLAEWLLEGKPEEIAANLSGLATTQLFRFVDIVEPIKDKCLGLIEGNHENTIMRRYNLNIHTSMVNMLDVEDLTDECLLRLRLKRAKTNSTRTVFVYMQHGWGAGRTASAEVLHLTRLRDEWEIADVVLRGHSHCFHILPPKPVLVQPAGGEFYTHDYERYRWAANWGCWKYSHLPGASTYESRASYPARAMCTCKVEIRPFKFDSRNGMPHRAHIEVRQVTL